MYRKLFLALLIIAIFVGSAYTQTTSQSIVLKNGFNFIAFTLKPLLSPTQLKAQFPIIEEIYTYSAASGSFLSISEGTLTTISAGKGYIIKANASASVSVDGSAVSSFGNIPLKAGFNLIGISKQINAINFSALVTNNPLVRGIYKYSAASGSFIQVIRNASGVAELIDGIDPTFSQGQSYFIYMQGDNTINYDGTSIIFGSVKTLSDVVLSKNSDTISSKAIYLLSNITVTAKYSDGTTQIITNPTWSIKSGGGILSGSTFTAPEIITNFISLAVNYSEGGISKETNLILTPTLLVSLSTVQGALQSSGARWTPTQTLLSQKILNGTVNQKNLTGLLKPTTSASAKNYSPSKQISNPYTRFSWKDKDGLNWITPVKDQGNYGTCVAFACGSALETRIRIKNNNSTLPEDFSELDFFYNGKKSEGVPISEIFDNGWDFDSALNYLKSTGIVEEPFCPYYIIPNCYYTTNNPSFTTTMDYEETSGIDNIKNALLSGPVIGGMKVYQDFFYYSGGIYEHLAGEFAGYHAICIIGFDDLNSCWIVKNSWSNFWGEEGYFRIKYGQCAIDDGSAFMAYSIKLADKINAVATPVANPAGGVYSGPLSVALSCTTIGATIKYSTDGSDPLTNGSTYITPISISANATLKMVATKSGLNNSDVKTESYVINLSKVLNPVITPSGGTYTSKQLVSISCATQGATIKYTIDESDPILYGYIYNSAFEVSKNITLKVIAIKENSINSDAVTTSYIINIPVVSNPTFNPADGTSFATSQQITISCSTSGATIKYTIDGSTPSATVGTTYSAPFTLSATATVKAIATKNGMTDSAIASAAYTKMAQAATPTFNPVGNTSFATSQQITISCATSGATIKYTTDGSTPSTTVGTPYTAPFTLSATTTIKAIAFNTGMTDSVVASATYTKMDQVATPTFNPADGTNFTTNQQVTISCPTSGAAIKYTTDGTIPSATAGTLYSAPFTLSTTATVKAIAIKSGMTDSTVSSATYTKMDQIAAPTFSPVDGTNFATSQQVTISCSTSGAVIKYTTDGTIPSATVGTPYSAPFTLSTTATVKAIATKSGMTDSAVSSATYTRIVQVATPTLSLVGGTYTTVQSITISCSTSGATIIYTTNSSVPSATNGIIYNSPINVSENTIIKVIAIKANMVDSEVLPADYSIKALPPTFSPVAGTYPSSQNVTITSTTSGATIKYTTDGTTPTSTNGLTYSGAIAVSQNTTIKAITIKSNMVDSNVASSSYIITNITIDLGDGVMLEMVKIPAGTFQMGEVGYSEPVHAVTISKDYYIGKFEVTQGQWTKIMGSTPSFGYGGNPSYFKSGDNYPVESMSWYDIVGSNQFLEKINTLTGKTLRLPTEAEWEYACRAGTNTAYYWGNDPSNVLIGNNTWYYGSITGLTTFPVGQKLPNAFGLYDMSGNVFEWCNDFYGGYPSSAVTDPIGPTSGLYHVLRGGSWNQGASYCRSAFRSSDNPSAGFAGQSSCGLRLALSQGQ
jgi:formylglycine-generating enzyme required for sulfatase activity/C1A family cysteine protease